MEAKEKAKNEEKTPVNTYLRYNEKLNLNRKNAQAVFKSMTRIKRDHIADGRGVIRDKVPDVGKYTTKVEITKP